MSKKVVVKLHIHDAKEKRKAMKTVSSLSGIESLAMDMKEKKLTVVGEVDPVQVVGKLRKFWHMTEILTVGPAKEEKKEDEKIAELVKMYKKKEDEKKKAEEKIAELMKMKKKAEEKIAELVKMYKKKKDEKKKAEEKIAELEKMYKKKEDEKKKLVKMYKNYNPY